MVNLRNITSRLALPLLSAALIGCSSVGQKDSNPQYFSLNGPRYEGVRELYSLLCEQSGNGKGNALVIMNGKEYAALADEEKEVKTLRVEVYNEHGEFERSFFDRGLDGLDKNPIPVIVGERKSHGVKVRDYEFVPALNKELVEREYLETVRRVTQFIEKERALKKGKI